MANKNAAPGAGGTQGGDLMRTSISAFEYNTFRGHSQAGVAHFLRRGEVNAIPTAQLLALTGLRNARELRAKIRRERQAGALILSTVRGHGGYFLPAEGEQGRLEIEAFVRTISARAINSQAALRAARRALREIEGQQKIVDLEGDSYAEE